MPSVSKKQHNLMAAVAKNPAFAKKVGIKQSVGQDFLEADKGKKFSGGGTMKHDDLMEDKKLIKKAVKMHDDQLHGGKKTNMAKLKKGGVAARDAHAEKEGRKVAKELEYDYKHGRKVNMCCGGKAKKMASGGLAAGHKSADGIATRGKTRGTEVKMKKGGKC